MNGAYVYTPAIWPPLASALVVAALGLYAWQRRHDVPAARPLVAAWLFRALWLVGIVLEKAAVDPGTKIFWFQFQVVWQLPTVTAGLCFVLEYAFPGRWLTRRNLILLAVPVLIDFLLNVAGGPQLSWRQLSVGPDGRVVAVLAPAVLVTTVYGLGLLLVNLAVMAWLFVRSPQHRWPVAIMVISQIATRALYVVGTANVPWPASLDPDVLSALIGTAGYAIALFGFRILDPLPAARTSALEAMRDGMLVFDPQWRVVSLNQAAANMTRSSASQSRGKPAAEILHAFGDLAARLAAGSDESFEVTLGSGAGARSYETHVSALRDFRDLLEGHLLMLHDVTEQRRAQAQILEQQQSLAVLKERERLARELHDELGQVLGYAKMQAQGARIQLAAQQPATADEFLAQLISATQDAHDDVREYILGTKAGAGGQLGFLPALQAYLQQFAARCGLRTELIVAPGLTSEDFEPMVQVQLQRIVQEALTNVRKHGQAHCVQVRFERADGRAYITVQDDGVGFDPESQATSEGGHFGLRFLQERAQEVGGSVAIVSSPGGGTRVEVEMPVTRRAGEGAPA